MIAELNQIGVHHEYIETQCPLDSVQCEELRVFITINISLTFYTITIDIGLTFYTLLELHIIRHSQLLANIVI